MWLQSWRTETHPMQYKNRHNKAKIVFHLNKERFHRTVQKLIDQHKVVLNVLLADLAKIGRHDVTHFIKELEHHGRVDILLGDGSQPDVGAFDMEETGAGDVGDGRADLLPRVDHVNAKSVHRVPPAERWTE